MRIFDGPGQQGQARSLIDANSRLHHCRVIMNSAITIEFPGELGSFVEQRGGKSGLYDSASEYIRDLVRRDYEQEEQRRWTWLAGELAPGMNAAESEFVPLDAASVITEAKARKDAHTQVLTFEVA